MQHYLTTSYTQLAISCVYNLAPLLPTFERRFEQREIGSWGRREETLQVNTIFVPSHASKQINVLFFRISDADGSLDMELVREGNFSRDDLTSEVKPCYSQLTMFQLTRF